MSKTIQKYLKDGSLENYSINSIEDVYRMYPVENNKTIKLRISLPGKKIIIKIKIYDTNSEKQLRDEILFNEKIQSSFPDNNLVKILDIYKIDELSLKILLNKLPMKYVSDLSEFIRGEFLVMIYENYENLFHMGNDMILVNRMNQIITNTEHKTLLFFSFIANLIHYYINIHNDSNNILDMTDVDIFNIGFRYSNIKKNINITIDNVNHSIQSNVEYYENYFIELIIVDYTGIANTNKLFNVNNFMPVNNNILYKYLTENTKYPYFPIETIKNIFGDVAAYTITNLSWIEKLTWSVNSQIEYFVNLYNLYDSHKFNDTTNSKVDNTYALNILQSKILINCQDKSLKCANEEINKLMDGFNNLQLILKHPNHVNSTEIGKIPSNLSNLYRKYEDIYGSNIFGSNKGITIEEKFTRRICIARYQYSQLKTAYLVSKSILENNYDFFDKFITKQLNKMMNLFETELYTVNGKFQKELFTQHFTTMTVDFIMPPINQFEQSDFLEKSYTDMIFDFIMSIKHNGNIRNKLFIYVAFSKILHYALIRKIFLIFYVNETKSDPKILFKYGINNNRITMDHINSTEEFKFDVVAYCKKHVLNYTIIDDRYVTVKGLLPLKKDDLGTDDLKTYLFDLIDKNLKYTFLLYLYDYFKYGFHGRIRFDGNKLKHKDYILVPKNADIIYPKVDAYEYYRRSNDSISFFDRGIDTQRMSVLEMDNIFIESFKNGEPVVAGTSGHTATIILCAGYLEEMFGPDQPDRFVEFINSMKIMTMICIATMFPRKDHSIFEMYRALQLFNDPFRTNKFTCPNENINTGSCFKWLLDGTTYSVDNIKFNGNDVYTNLQNKIGKSFEYYLSPEYKRIINDVVNVFFHDNQVITSSDLVKMISTIINKKFNDINAELFIIMSIIRKEGERLWMSDAEYAYNIELKHLSIRNFVNNNYSVPEFLTNDDIFLYEDDIVTCTRSVNDIIKPVNDFDNTCLILQKIYRKLSKNVCFR